MALHDDLLDALRAVANVHLVARLVDARLGCPDPDDLRVFVPDLHLVSDAVRKRYSYNTNHTDLLADVLYQIAALRSRRGADQTLSVYQLGDCFDLWREEPLPDRRTDAANAVFDSHERLMEVMLSRGVKTRFLLGNHDIDLHRWPNYRAWSRRYYIQPKQAAQPTLLALHGDVFDWIEQLPDELQQLIVYVTHPMLEGNDYDLGDMVKVVTRLQQGVDYSKKIQGNASLGAAQALDGAPLPESFNVKRFGGSKKSTQHFAAARDLAADLRRQHAGLDLRCIVIGHTHNARIVVPKSDDDDFFALVDCGAWIEDCSAKVGGKTVRMPNAQIGVVGANDVRIYQIAPKGMA